MLSGRSALLSAACVHRQLALDDAVQWWGTSALGYARRRRARRRPTARHRRQRRRITEADWQMMIAPRSGPHGHQRPQRRHCRQPVAIGQDYL
jgi:hypothetical protein